MSHDGILRDNLRLEECPSVDKDALQPQNVPNLELEKMSDLAPLNNEIMDRNDVMQSPILPGTRSEGTKTDMMDPRQSIVLGK